MNKLAIETNRNYAKKQINIIIDDLFNDLKKMSCKVDSLEKDKKRIRKNKVILAKAYARKIGVILTQKEYNKKFTKGPLHGIIIRKGDAYVGVSE